MYVLYLKSFLYLKAFEVALFTVFTPIYIVLVDALLERHWRSRFLYSALLAVAGAALVLNYGEMTSLQWRGFLMIQGSNLSFSIGQLLWRREHARLQEQATDAQLFAIPYAGALVLTGLISLWSTDWHAFTLTPAQQLTILYLGIVASGLCFFMWNVGAERVNAGTLAVMNNAKMPIAVAVSLLITHEQASIGRLASGCLIVGVAAWLAARRSPAST